LGTAPHYQTGSTTDPSPSSGFRLRTPVRPASLTPAKRLNLGTAP